MKKIFTTLFILVSIICSVTFLGYSHTVKAGDSFIGPYGGEIRSLSIIGNDGVTYTVKCIMTPQNGPGSYAGCVVPFSVHAAEVFVDTKNAYGGYLAPGGVYYESGPKHSADKPAPASTPATPKAESKKEEPKCEHEYSAEVTTEPTCKDKGVKTYTCTKCGDTYTEEIDIINTHTFDENKEEVIKEATCTEDGISAKACKICGYKEESSIPKLEHQYKEKVTKEATCTENGVKTFTCELCSDSYTEDIDAVGHNEGEFEITKPNGLFSDGEQIKKCTVCNEVLAKEVIPAKFPIWYLYCGIGLFVVIIGLIAVLITKRNKKEKQ